MTRSHSSQELRPELRKPYLCLMVPLHIGSLKNGCAYVSVCVRVWPGWVCPWLNFLRAQLRTIVRLSQTPVTQRWDSAGRRRGWGRDWAHSGAGDEVRKPWKTEKLDRVRPSSCPSAMGNNSKHGLLFIHSTSVYQYALCDREQSKILPLRSLQEAVYTTPSEVLTLSDIPEALDGVFPTGWSFLRYL